jgi:hypothetical protein
MYNPRFVARLLLIAIPGSHSHRTLLAFHVATMHDYLSNAPSLDDGILAFTLPSLLTPLQSSQKDPNLAVSSLAANSLHSALRTHRLARKFCSSVHSLAKSHPETCCSIRHHQRNDDSSARSSGLGKRFCIYCSFRQDCCGDVFVTRNPSGVPPQCSPVVRKDVVCRFYISSHLIIGVICIVDSSMK